eukprot:CAMPEP_0171176184 /NCGR_PEP_ID=MMETSP0790-20130122/11605_1 /TAXON_ID=2925 /ORGANISM="Alexandrium catenella, Strain OF101" /LENGTH=145 /DNA_ID=CAMNT_0011641067 /DNA_START=147 /DNA_END=584 /DNA_ORIENTATION=-
MEGSSTAFLSAETLPSGKLSMKRSTLAALAVALLVAGGLAVCSAQALSASVAPAGKTAFMAVATQASKSQTRPAVALLTLYGQNATLLQPTLLYYNDCLACYTCGERWVYKVAELHTGAYVEFGADCSDPDHLVRNDNAYVCCAR